MIVFSQNGITRLSHMAHDTVQLIFGQSLSPFEGINALSKWIAEAEWEKSARGIGGIDGRIYPWGNEAPNCKLANIPDCVNNPNADGPVYFASPVGSYPDGKSPYGAVDMIGNVAEWVSDWYDQTYYANSPDKNPEGPLSGRFRLLRGGSGLQVASAVSRTWALPNRVLC